MATIELRDVVKKFGDKYAVKPMNMTIQDGEFVVLLGPSGCGKTTTLRMISGLEAVSSGNIFLNGKDVTWAHPSARDIAYVFQFYALYPHLTVRDNIAFPLQAQAVKRDEIERRVKDVSNLLKIKHLLKRRPGGLSGGDQQRVALARALAPDPRLLMLDEPLGALDRALRERLVDELRTIFAGRDRAVLLVTHDHEEAFALADRVVVLDAGRVEQDADATEVWQRPATPFVARFLGYNVTAAFGPLLAVRPEGLRLSVGPGAPAGGVPVTVVDRTFRRDHFRVRVRTAAGEVLDVAFRGPAIPEPGTPGRLELAADAVVLG